MPSVIARGTGVEGAGEHARERQHVVDLVGVVAAPGGDHRGVAVRDRRVAPRASGWRARTRSRSRAIRATASSATAPALRPRNTSAPASASSSEPVRPDRLVSRRGPPSPAVRPARSGMQDAARVGDGDVTDARRQQDRVHATPAAPAPETTTRSWPRLRPVTRAALRSAASTTIAVPCWSSWNTGMLSRSRRRASISKHRGAEMSSRLIPPKDGAIRSTVSHDLVRVGRRQHDRDGVQAGELAEQRRLALHHRQGGARADVAEPEHRRAVTDDRHQPRAPGVGAGQPLVLVDRRAHLGDAGRVGERERVPVDERHRAAHPQLAVLVHAEDRTVRVETHGERPQKSSRLRPGRGAAIASVAVGGRPVPTSLAHRNCPRFGPERS